MDLKDIILELERMGAIKFGDYVLKSGIKSPVYFDLRVMVEKPKLVKAIADIMWKTFTKSQKSGSKPDLLCGVPYTALPLATLISVSQDIPSIIKRKEKKAYGTKKMLEGKFEEGEKCLIIEDVVSSGMSVLETVEELKKEKLKITDVVVFLDREQGGQENLKEKDINVHNVVNVTDLINILHGANRISDEEKKNVEDFIVNNKLNMQGE